MATNASYNDHICACMTSWDSCCKATWIPCYLEAENHALVNARQCTFADAKGCCLAYCVRQQLRAKYGFKKSSVYDCFACLFCHPFMICQDHRELKYQLRSSQLLKGLYYELKDEYKESTDQGITVHIKETWKRRGGESWLYQVSFDCSNTRNQPAYFYISCDGINFECKKATLPMSKVLEASKKDHLFTIEEKDLHGISNYRYTWRWNSKP